MACLKRNPLRRELNELNNVPLGPGYDENNRLSVLTHRGNVGQVIASYAYTLGPIGNRTRIDEATGISRRYTYDDLYRLTKEDVVDPSIVQTYTNDFTYDAVGNRQNKTHADSSQPVGSNDYTYNDTDQLLSENGITYSYDLNGNLEHKTDVSGTTTYGYDYDNRLVTVTTPTQSLSYAYDADGNRIESTGPEGTIRYLVDANRSLSQVLAEYKLGGTVIASYTYADDLISMTRGEQTSWYHFDGLGSTRQLTNEAGEATDAFDYDAFGNLISRTGTTENSFLFTGQRYDANTGFYHLRARYYQPRVGIFTSVDMYAGDLYSPVTLHKYGYVLNNPINYVDLTGWVPQLIRGILAHRHISAMFFKDRPYASTSNYYLSAVTGIASAGYVDLVDTKEKEYYEIKPYTQTEAGVAQLAKYGFLFGLHSIFDMKLGTSWPTEERTEPFMGDSKATITYWLSQSESGLISYQINGDDDFDYNWHMLRQTATSTTTSVIAAATVSSLVRIFVPKIAGITAANMSLLQSEIGLAAVISNGL
ncbi:RHS repeat domain-containing protein [Geomonas anaerohicana]|uniref:RHS repeat-associated core domain-containing protein n=1 Tax=Geomonas anaerohicana TaxID=2798583 RepID=A0ABS0YGT0_9BACT|nr:RHS repeat-associated core domain-containing protein [Geomonas anaerohicana]MBJ6751476.1 hypothetical protein [Geomonas anaerohicana]